MAPETLQNMEFSMDSEVFAIGVIIYEMLQGKTPWTALSEK
jgi:serine/threonine protein kinase